jgi:hypothetical protein
MQWYLQKGKFSTIEKRYLQVYDDDYMSLCDIDFDMLDPLRWSFKARWDMPQWFVFRDAVKAELIRRGKPWPSLMAGLFGTIRWENNV